MSAESLAKNYKHVIDGDLEEVSRHALAEAMKKMPEADAFDRRLHHDLGRDG